jgi:uncharacterized membrane protein (DUF4010 family)
MKYNKKKQESFSFLGVYGSIYTTFASYIGNAVGILYFIIISNYILF